MRFDQARLKVERANKHISDLDARIADLPNLDVATIEVNPSLGNEVIKHDIPFEGNDLALLAGDAMHNLKCALDYTWCEILAKLAPSAVGKFSKFPVYETKTKLEDALKGRNIHTLAPNLFELILDDIRPYEDGDFAIWAVHRLNIRDKHRLLIPLIYYTSIHDIEIENGVGEVSRDGFTMATTHKPPYYVPMRPGWRVRNKGRVSVSVMFEYGIAGRESRIVDSFALYSRFILATVETLERYYEQSHLKTSI